MLLPILILLHQRVEDQDADGVRNVAPELMDECRLQDEDEASLLPAAPLRLEVRLRDA
jgi:hypothetical protein